MGCSMSQVSKLHKAKDRRNDMQQRGAISPMVTRRFFAGMDLESNTDSQFATASTYVDFATTSTHSERSPPKKIPSTRSRGDGCSDDDKSISLSDKSSKHHDVGTYILTDSQITQVDSNNSGMNNTTDRELIQTGEKVSETDGDVTNEEST